MSSQSLPLLYQGSVKDVRGPIQVPTQLPTQANGSRDTAVVFDYTDAYSVFDWGKMPDALKHKGESLAIIAADWFEKLESAETWKEFSKSPTALALRKGNRFGSAFNELGEVLQREGLRTHYLGTVGSDAQVASLKEQSAPFRQIAVKQVSVVKPDVAPVMGRSVFDYTHTRASSSPRLVPLEVVFRFSCPSGSSLIDRVARDPQYLASIGYPGLRVGAGERYDFPILELFTKLESTDRLLTLSEALAISGLSASKLQEVMFKTAWVAAWVRSVCAKKGLDLADGKLEWAIEGEGEAAQLILVDAIGPDELRILSAESGATISVQSPAHSPVQSSVQLSKEFLRAFYRPTEWYARVNKAKQDAESKGSTDWKRGVSEGPQELTPQFRELASQLYQCLANELTGRTWFTGAWPLSRVIQELHQASRRESS